MSKIDYNPLDPEVMADPFPTYARMRAECPVAHFDGLDVPYHILFRYEDVREASTDTSQYTAKFGASPTFRDTFTMTDDGPSHLAFRNVFQERLMPRGVKAYEPDAERFAEELVAAMKAKGHADLHDDFAVPLPVKVAAVIIGVADADYRILGRHAERLLNSAWMAADPDKYRDYLAEVEDFFNGYIDARLATLEAAGVSEPGREHLGALLPDDIISDLICGKVMDRRLTRPEMLALLQVLLVGGYETSTFMITNCIWRLLEDRSRWEAVKADPDRLIPIAIEESLRFDPPGLGLWRTTACPVAKHGEVIPEHYKVQMSYGSANRDPAMFEDGDSFRLDRTVAQARRHLTFGAGPHMCVGQHLARMDMAVALRALIRGLPDLRLDGETERVANFGFWGRKKLPVAW